MEVHGFCDPKFDAVREAMVQNFEQHGDVGASVALTLEGEFVIDRPHQGLELIVTDVDEVVRRAQTSSLS